MKAVRAPEKILGGHCGGGKVIHAYHKTGRKSRKSKQRYIISQFIKLWVTGPLMNSITARNHLTKKTGGLRMHHIRPYKLS
jgi:hypothetical protein